jgi:hypothetical protein
MLRANPWWVINLAKKADFNSAVLAILLAMQRDAL